MVAFSEFRNDATKLSVNEKFKWDTRRLCSLDSAALHINLKIN